MREASRSDQAKSTKQGIWVSTVQESGRDSETGEMVELVAIRTPRTGLDRRSLGHVATMSWALVALALVSTLERNIVIRPPGLGLSLPVTSVVVNLSDCRPSLSL